MTRKRPSRRRPEDVDPFSRVRTPAVVVGVLVAIVAVLALGAIVYDWGAEPAPAPEPSAGSGDGGTADQLDRGPDHLIDQPTTGTVLNASEPIRFIAVALPPSDACAGAPHDAWVWTSDLDGLIGRGAALEARLSPGTHTVNLTVRNGPDCHRWERTVVVVNQARNLSAVAIVEPDVDRLVANSTDPDTGTPYVDVRLRGQALDQDGETLAGVALTWTIEPGNITGRGDEVVARLTVAPECDATRTYAIELAGSTDDGARATDRLTLTVVNEC